jgi:hypothetical protein
VGRSFDSCCGCLQRMPCALHRLRSRHRTGRKVPECSNPQAGEVLSHLRDRPAAPRGSRFHAFNAFARRMRGRPAPTKSPSPVLWFAWRQEECRKTVLAIFQQDTSPVQTVRPAWPCRFRLHFEPPGSTPRVPREYPSSTPSPHNKSAPMPPAPHVLREPVRFWTDIRFPCRALPPPRPPGHTHPTYRQKHSVLRV